MNYAPFDEIRPKLEKQYENAVFSPEECWEEARLREAWEMMPSRLPQRQAFSSR